MCINYQMRSSPEPSRLSKRPLFTSFLLCLSHFTAKSRILLAVKYIEFDNSKKDFLEDSVFILGDLIVCSPWLLLVRYLTHSWNSFISTFKLFIIARIYFPPFFTFHTFGVLCRDLRWGEERKKSASLFFFSCFPFFFLIFFQELLLKHLKSLVYGTNRSDRQGCPIYSQIKKNHTGRRC